MLKYANIINKKTKQCDVGLGSDISFFKSIGMTEMEVEQGYNGVWYVEGYAPQKPLEELKQEKILELKEKRNEYKKTIFIKDKNLVDLEDKNKYHFDNLILGLCGYTEKDFIEYKTYIENIAKTYDNYKARINNSATKKELKNIIITF